MLRGFIQRDLRRLPRAAARHVPCGGGAAAAAAILLLLLTAVAAIVGIVVKRVQRAGRSHQRGARAGFCSRGSRRCQPATALHHLLVVLLLATTLDVVANVVAIRWR